MKVFIFIVLIMISANHTFPENEKISSDKSLSEKIVGTWSINLNENGIQIIGNTIYTSDGIVNSRVKIQVGSEEFDLVLQETWSIENGQLISTTKESSLPQMVPIGETSKDTIIEISNDILKYKDEDGRIEILKKTEETSSLLSDKSKWLIKKSFSWAAWLAIFFLFVPTAKKKGRSRLVWFSIGAFAMWGTFLISSFIGIFVLNPPGPAGVFQDNKLPFLFIFSYLFGWLLMVSVFFYLRQLPAKESKPLNT